MSVAAAPVVVRVATCPADRAHDVLRQLVRREAGLADDQPVRLVHACPTCGSPEHGRPVVVGLGDLHVSLSRDRDRHRAVVATCRGARVGIDLELARAVDFGGFDAVALHPDEDAPDAVARTRLWTGKEAVLKCRGTGLAVDPRSLLLASVDEQVLDVEVGPQCCCRLAVATARPVAVLRAR